MKELEKTPFITALLTKAVGEGVDTSKLHVYEVRATSTVALRGKTGTIFEKAKISPNTIAQLARTVNDDPLPLMMDHDLRGSPYGKFFYGESIPMDNGETELRGYMYVDDSDPKIVTKLEAASIDEVSIQFKSTHMLCSECGFDYRKAVDEENYLPLIMLECDEGHKIGKDGVHVNLVGVDEAVELSLVSRGAAKNSKIIASSDAKLGQEAQRLAANGVELESIYVTASVGDSEGVDNVDLKELTTKLSQLTDDKIDLTTKLNTETAKTTALEADIAAKDTEIADLKAQLKVEKDKTPEISSDDVAKLKAFVGKQFVALKALDGDATATAPESIEDLTTFVDENEARLSVLIPAGGKAQGAGGASKTDEELATERQEATLKLQADAYKSPVRK